MLRDARLEVDRIRSRLMVIKGHINQRRSARFANQRDEIDGDGPEAAAERRALTVQIDEATVAKCQAATVLAAHNPQI